MIGGYVKIDLSKHNLEDNVNSRSVSHKIEEILFFLEENIQNCLN